MKFLYKGGLVLVGVVLASPLSNADTLPTHRIPAELAVEAAIETISACAKQGYRETAVVLDADGATIVSVRGDGAGIHTLDSAHDKDVHERLIQERHRCSSVVVALSLSSKTKRSGQLAQAARRAPSWMMAARGPDWQKFGIV